MTNLTIIELLLGTILALAIIYTTYLTQTRMAILKYNHNVLLETLSEHIHFGKKINMFGNTTDFIVNIYGKDAQIKITDAKTKTAYSHWDAEAKCLNVVIPEGNRLYMIQLDHFLNKDDAAIVNIAYTSVKKTFGEAFWHDTEIDLTIYEKDPPKQEGLPFFCN